MKISICVPAYEMHGKGPSYIGKLFYSIKQQTYKNFEVIVSDHSANDDIKKTCSSWSSEFPLVYLPYSRKRGNSSANLNNAIAAATGAVIKIMHQDDLLYSERCLEKIAEAVVTYPQAIWGACGFVLTDEEGEMYYGYWTPFYNPDILFRNTIGHPSAVFYRTSNTQLFDERLIYLNDSELYYRLYVKYGDPIVINEPLVAIRWWSGQVSNTLVTTKLRAKEILYLTRKHVDRACVSLLKEAWQRCFRERRPDLSAP
jgi:glycosyltransferase involved in cell wall biosynthesis